MPSRITLCIALLCLLILLGLRALAAEPKAQGQATFGKCEGSLTTRACDIAFDERTSNETIHPCLPGVHSLLWQSTCDVFGSNGQLKWKLLNLLCREFGLKPQVAPLNRLRDPDFQITDQPVWLVNRTLLL